MSHLRTNGHVIEERSILSVNLQAYRYAIAENDEMTLHITFTNLPDLKMPVAIVTGGNKGIGLGVVRICV